LLQVKRTNADSLRHGAPS